MFIRRGSEHSAQKQTPEARNFEGLVSMVAGECGQSGNDRTVTPAPLAGGRASRLSGSRTLNEAYIGTEATATAASHPEAF